MRKSRYGLTDDAYRSMLDSQSNTCAICKEETQLHVDHDHSTGRVRGLLCGPCNRGIGMLRDSVPRLEAAIEYLRKPCHLVVTAEEKNKNKEFEFED